MLATLCAMLAVLGLAAFVFCAVMLFLAFRDTPRKCAYPGCTTNHWNLEKFCSHHIEDQYFCPGCGVAVTKEEHESCTGC